MLFTILNVTSLEHFKCSQWLILCFSLCSFLDYELVSPQQNLYMNWFMHYMCVCVHTCVLWCIQLFAISWTVPTRLLHPWNFPGKNTGVGCHFLIQGIFPPGIKSASFMYPALAGRFFTTAPPGKPHIMSSFLYLSML